MSLFDFDTIPDRRNDYTVKYDLLKTHFGKADLIPLWVADMEFKCAPCIKNALQKIVDTGLFGYNVEPIELKPTIARWLFNVQSWKVENEWISYIPGVVRGISYAIHHFTRPGDKVIVQTPVYFPFMNVPRDNGRELVFNPIKVVNSEDYTSARYKFDLDHLEKITLENDCKMLILCNPHNPGGMNWSREELIQLAEICYKRGIIVISDEIHADLTLWGEKHIPFATVSEKAAQISITFGAPSKTFNIPGLATSFAVIPNPEIRNSFYKWLSLNQYNVPLITASMAIIAAYTEGNPWRVEVLKYIEGNILFLEEYCRKYIPQIKVIRPSATYLVWLDCRGFGLSQQQLEDLFINKAGLALNSGTEFGTEGEGFMRLNIACPRQMLEQALGQLSM